MGEGSDDENATVTAGAFRMYRDMAPGWKRYSSKPCIRIAKLAKGIFEKLLRLSRVSHFLRLTNRSADRITQGVGKMLKDGSLVMHEESGSRKEETFG